METSAAKKKLYSHKQCAENREHKQSVLPDVIAKPFIPNVSQDNRQGVFPATHQVRRPTAPLPTRQQNNAAQPTDTANTPVCYYHQTFGDKARTCREPCAFSLNYVASARLRLLRLASQQRRDMTTRKHVKGGHSGSGIFCLNYGFLTVICTTRPSLRWSQKRLRLDIYSREYKVTYFRSRFSDTL